MKPVGLDHAGLAGTFSRSGVLPALLGGSYNQEVTWSAGIKVEASGWGVKQEKNKKQKNTGE